MATDQIMDFVLYSCLNLGVCSKVRDEPGGCLWVFVAVHILNSIKLKANEDRFYSFSFFGKGLFLSVNL